MRIIVCLFISLRILQCSYAVGRASISDEEAFEEFIKPIEEVIGLPEIWGQQQARMHSRIFELGKMQIAAAIPYWAALLYYDDSGVEVIEEPGLMHDVFHPPVSAAAAGTLHRMLGIPEIEELFAASLEKKKTSARKSGGSKIRVNTALKIPTLSERFSERPK